MKLIQFFLFYSRLTVIAAVIAGVLSGACTTTLIALINASLRSENPLSAKTMAAFTALVLMLPIARFTSETLLTRLGQNALFELRMRLSAQALALPLRYVEQIGWPRILAMLTDDIPTITSGLVPIPGICINVAVLLGGLLYLGWLSPLMLLVTICPLALGIAGYQVAVFHFTHHIRLVRQAADRLLQHFTAMAEGAKELKMHSHRRGDFLTRMLAPAAEAYRRHSIDGLTYHAAASSLGQSLVFIIIGLVVFVSLRLAHAEPHIVTGYVIVLIFITAPLQVIMNLAPAIGRANVAVAKVRELGLEVSANAEVEAENVELPNRAWQELELAGVSFTYQREGDDAQFTLGPIDLSLRRGEMVFIIGGNGSGKTTLAKLLAGLYLPDRGSVSIDNSTFDEKNIEMYRQYFSAVFSDFYLFEDLPGLSDNAVDAKVKGYLERLELARKVQFSDGKLSTLKLSHGQRKRVALLTAYLEDRPIYLFDEWAADQDPHFKDTFYHHLLPELKARGKALLVITHDERYYHLADRLIKLEDGQIVSSPRASDSGGLLDPCDDSPEIRQARFRANYNQIL
jgi:putative pyoverdin transport system ATP-binding/permease protein